MSPTDCAWAAGFFDGEGCVHIHRDTVRANRELASYKLGINVCGRNRAALDKLVTLFGGRVRPYYKREYPEVSYYAWTLFSRKARAALAAMLPYLVNKRDVAELAVEFQDWYMGVRVYGRAMPDARRARAETYKVECHRLVRLHRQPQGSKISSPSLEEADRRAG